LLVPEQKNQPTLSSALHVFNRLAPSLAFPIGALLASAFAPLSAWPLAILCQTFLFVAWQDAAPRHAAKIGFFFTAGTFLAGTYWLYHTIYVIGHAPLWVALLLMIGLVAIMGAFTAGVGYVQARWFPRAGVLRWLFALPSIWTALEYMRGSPHMILGGFPWLSLGYSQIDSPLSGLAPVLGVYGLSWLTALSAGALTTLIVAKRLRLRVIALVLLIIPWVAGIAFRDHEWTQEKGNSLSVAIVQGAVPQELKWSAEQRDATLQLYWDLTRPHLGQQLIIWPEAALPGLAEYLGDYIAQLHARARASGSSLLVGAVHTNNAENEYYNGLLALNDHAEWYDKRRLVPFGEFFPVPRFIREWMRLMNLPYADLTPGAADQPPLDAAGEKIAATICYEDAYGAQQLPHLDVATVLVNVTNDAWFGDSTARHQHLEISRMRALEAGRPLLRAANDGISAIIAANGAVENTLIQFKAGVLSGTIRPRIGLTPYARTGNWPVMMLCIVCIASALLYRRRTD
jgi:apolipoprotein N-acyltransferase